MKHSKSLYRTLAISTVACLLCFTIAHAKKPKNPGGGGGKETAPFTVVDLLGLPGGSSLQSQAVAVNEPDGSGAVQLVGNS